MEEIIMSIIEEWLLGSCGCEEAPTTKTRKYFFGLIEERTTKACSHRDPNSSEHYVGPPNKFWLWIAIVYGSEKKRLLVNYEWVFRARGHGLYGPGICGDELGKLKKT